MSIKKSVYTKADGAVSSFGAAEKVNSPNLELLDEINRMLEAETEDTLDTEKLERYLALLQDRAPVMEDYDPRQTLTELKKNIPHFLASAGTPQEVDGIRLALRGLPRSLLTFCSF